MTNLPVTNVFVGLMVVLIIGLAVKVVWRVTDPWRDKKGGRRHELND